MSVWRLLNYLSRNQCDIKEKFWYIQFCCMQALLGYTNTRTDRLTEEIFSAVLLDELYYPWPFCFILWVISGCGGCGSLPGTGDHSDHPLDVGSAVLHSVPLLLHTGLITVSFLFSVWKKVKIPHLVHNETVDHPDTDQWPYNKAALSLWLYCWYLCSH